jgi:hypothetical protein
MWRGPGGALWRNPWWLPEIRVAGRTVRGGWGLLTSENLDFSTTAVVPDETPIVEADRTDMRVEELSGARIAVVTDCDGPCLLVAARPWAPGWAAAIDGEPAPVVLANLAGLGVVVQPGPHRVTLDYGPWRWRNGVP